MATGWRLQRPLFPEILTIDPRIPFIIMSFRRLIHRSEALRFPNTSIFLATTALAFSTASSHAEDGLWTHTEAGGSWSNGANWQSATIAAGTASSATFDGAGTTVDVDSARVIGRLDFGGTGIWTLSGAGILTLDGGSEPPRITTAVDSVVSVGLAGTNGFLKDGAGLLTLGGANTYSGTTEVKAGTLAGSAAQISGAGLTLSGGTLQLNAQAQTLTKTIAVSGTGTLNFLRGSNVLAGTVSGESNAVISFSSGDRAAAALTIRSDFNAYQGTVVLAKPSLGFTFRLDTTSAPGSGKNSLWQIDAGSTLLFNAGSNFNTTVIELGGLKGAGTLSGGSAAGAGSIAYQIGGRGGNTTFSGAIQDGLTKTRLLKTGDGILELAGASTYTGATNVNQGTLHVSGSLTGTASVEVASGATLRVDGSVSALVNVASGGALTGSGILANGASIAGQFSPGNSPGTLDLGGDLVLLATAVSNFEFSSGTFTAGSYDLVNGLTSTAHLDGILSLSFNGADGSIRILNFASFAGDFDAIQTTGLGAGQAATFDPLTGTVNIQAIPEPSSLLAACAFGMMTLFRRRRA